LVLGPESRRSANLRSIREVPVDTTPSAPLRNPLASKNAPATEVIHARCGKPVVDLVVENSRTEISAAFLSELLDWLHGLGHRYVHVYFAGIEGIDWSYLLVLHRFRDRLRHIGGRLTADAESPLTAEQLTLIGLNGSRMRSWTPVHARRPTDKTEPDMPTAGAPSTPHALTMGEN
jgi:anti-anti-sigma regulatory factor